MSSGLDIDPGDDGPDIGDGEQVIDKVNGLCRLICYQIFPFKNMVISKCFHFNSSNIPIVSESFIIILIILKHPFNKGS